MPEDQVQEPQESVDATAEEPTAEAQPAEGAVAEPQTPETQETEEPWKEKFESPAAVWDGYQNAQKRMHEATQEAAELKRRLEAVQTQQPQPQKPPSLMELPEEQFTEKLFTNPKQTVLEVAQAIAAQRTQPLEQWAVEMKLQQMEEKFPGFKEHRGEIEKAMADLTAGNVDLAETAYRYVMGGLSQDLQAQAKQEGAQQAYQMQQQKVAAQPPSAKSQPQTPQVSIPPEEDKIRQEWGYTTEEWLKHRSGGE